MGNKYIKQLKSFDIKKDLVVNEKFRPPGTYSGSDTLSDLEYDEMEMGGGDSGKEFCSYKTGGGILSGIVSCETNLGKGVILTGNKNGEIYMLTPDQNTLKPLVKLRIQGSIVRTPGYSDGVIYCVTREGMLYAIDTGLGKGREQNPGFKPQVIWTQKADKGILTEPIVTGKMLIVATLGGIFGYEAYYRDENNKAVGKRLWGTPVNGTVSSPRMHGGNIYMGTEDNHLIAFDYGGNNISKAWDHKTSGPVRSKPFVTKDEKEILFTTTDGFLYCVNRRKGKYKWNYVIKSPSYSSIVSADMGGKEYFFFGADNGIFYCINREGKKVWEYGTNGKIRTEALVSGQRIFFGSEDNNFYCLNIKNGELLFKFPTDGNINSLPVILDNVIYFGSTDSFIHGVYI